MALPVCFTKGFLAPGAKPSDLVKKLIASHATLREIDQDTQTPGLDNLAASLVLPGLLQGATEEVSLLACCCLVDVLRLYAPDAPYSDEQKLVRGVALAIPSQAALPRPASPTPCSRTSHNLPTRRAQ